MFGGCTGSRHACRLKMCSNGSHRCGSRSFFDVDTCISMTQLVTHKIGVDSSYEIVNAAHLFDALREAERQMRDERRRKLDACRTLLAAHQPLDAKRLCHKAKKAGLRARPAELTTRNARNCPSPAPRNAPSASFHSYDPRRLGGKEFQYLRSPQLRAESNGARGIRATSSKIILGQFQSDSDNVCH